MARSDALGKGEAASPKRPGPVENNDRAEKKPRLSRVSSRAQVEETEEGAGESSSKRSGKSAACLLDGFHSGTVV